MSLHARLVVVGGEVKASEIKLRLPCTIGRGRGSTIVLAHPLVSRQHCELFEDEGKLMVRDLGSLNGTFVNNQRINGAAPLPPNELLTIGTVTFRAVYDDSTAEEAAGEVAAGKEGIPDTVYAGRAAPGGSGTVPLPLQLEIAEARAAIEAAAEEGSSAAPVAGASLESAPKSPLPLPPESAEEAPQPAAKDLHEEAATEQERAANASDDDLQDFLKSLGK